MLKRKKKKFFFLVSVRSDVVDEEKNVKIDFSRFVLFALKGELVWLVG